MFDELLAHPGVEEINALRSSFGFMAFHGGSLEQKTDDIALAAAERSGASVYAVVQPPGFRWHLPSAEIAVAAARRSHASWYVIVQPDTMKRHVPSHEHDPAEAPLLAAFLDHVDVAVAVHGFGRPDMFTTLLLGGQNRALGRHLRSRLQRALPDFDVVDDLDRIPRELRGMHPDNPVNRPRAAGVQLELPPRVRGLGPFWADFRAEHGDEAHPPHTEALIAALAEAATTWP